MLDESSRLIVNAAYIPNTKSRGSYSSTERTDRSRDEALAQRCRSAADASDVAAPMLDLEGTTSADRVGSWGFPSKDRRSPSFGRHSAVCSCARCEI